MRASTECTWRAALSLRSPIAPTRAARRPLDEAVARGAVATLQASGEALAGYGIDFCVIKRGGGFLTALMEVNDGSTTGVYDGVSAADYTAMVEARWQQLLGGACGGGGA